MRVLICGDRNWNDKKAIQTVVKSFPKDTVIIEGEAQGADTLARVVAQECGITVLPFPADWNTYHKAAGPIRNKAMLDALPDCVFAFHNDIDSSKGTKNMLNQAKKRGVRCCLCSVVEGVLQKQEI